MASATTQKNKNAIKKRQAFLRDVKKGKYGATEKTTIVYSRLNEQAQPYENTQKNTLFYGIR